MNARSFVLFSVIAVSAACSAKYVGKNYDGPDLPENQVGIVTFSRIDDQAAILCKVNGQSVNMDPKDRSVSVLPGKHAVLFLFVSPNRRSVAVEWTFSVEAGHKYAVKFPERQPPSSTVLWLEDLTAGKRVTDITSSPLKSNYACL
jgi:hypothetical protein